jgi:hyperosmotically inducible protein
MKTVIVVALAVALGWALPSHAQQGPADNAGKYHHPAANSGQGYPADNTGKNARDASGDTLTAGDQPENAGDRDITQGVRKAIVANDDLSTNAHNVKIITVNGVVTLRGPVNSADEKAKVAATATKVAGVKRVDNQLEVVTR